MLSHRQYAGACSIVNFHAGWQLSATTIWQPTANFIPASELVPKYQALQYERS